MFFIIFILFFSINDATNKFCDFDSTTFQRDNAAYISGLGNWTNRLDIYLPGVIPDDDFIVGYVASIPYWSINTYNEHYCRFEFNQTWIISCDSTSCPSLTPGLYLGFLVNYAPLIPRHKDCLQTYSQSYITPILPTFPDQRPLAVYAVNLSPVTQVDAYINVTTGKSTLEEVISIRSPTQRIYSSQGYSESQLNPGSDIMNPWIAINSTIIPVFPEPAYSGFELFSAGLFPLVEYAPGKSAYLLPIDVKKRSSINPKMMKNLIKIPELSQKHKFRIPLI